MTKNRDTRREKQQGEGLSFPAIILGMFGFMGAYLFAEAGLDPQAHLLHWLVAAGGAAVGVGAGWLWQWLRSRFA